MSIFIMLCGVPASGKSRFAEGYISDHPDTVYISSDAHIEAIAADEGLSYQDAYKAHAAAVRDTIRAEAVRALKAGQQLLWDQTNLTPEVRAEVLALVPANYLKTAIAFEAPEELLNRRLAEREQRLQRTIPQEVLRAQRDAYRRPTKSEGFDHIGVQDNRHDLAEITR